MMLRPRPRRRMPSDDRHRCQPRELTVLFDRRSFRADTRTFAIPQRYKCRQCGLTASRPSLLCAPEVIRDRATAPGIVMGAISTGRGYPQAL